MTNIANTIAKTLVVGFMLVAGVAYAKGERTDPDAKARAALMQTVSMNTKVLGDMAGGKTGYDATAAESARTALTDAASRIPTTFKTQGAPDPASEVKPEIWTNWDDFVKKAGVLEAAATALDPSSLDGIKAGMAGVGGACKDCHTTYRM